MKNVLEGDTVAQLAHVGWGLGLTLLLGLLFMPLMFHFRFHYPLTPLSDIPLVSVVTAAYIVVIFAAGKEIFEAAGIAWWEPKQDWGSSARDFAFWVVGVLVAVVGEIAAAVLWHWALRNG